MEKNNPSKIINFIQVNEITGGNSVLYIQMMDLFIKLAPVQLKRVKKAYIYGNYSDLISAAHDLKSSASSLAAESLFEASLTLEQSSKNELDLNTISSMIKEVERKISEMIKFYRNENWGLYFNEEL